MPKESIQQMIPPRTMQGPALMAAHTDEHNEDHLEESYMPHEKPGKSGEGDDAMIERRIGGLRAVTPAQAKTDTMLLTFKEAMEFLRVSRSTIYRLMWSGQLQGHKVGSAWRFYESDLLAAVSTPPAAGGLAQMASAQASSGSQGRLGE